MTAALWIIAVALVALVLIIAASSWTHFYGYGQSRLEVLSDAEVAALLAPNAEIRLMPADGAPPPIDDPVFEDLKQDLAR